MCAFSCRLLFKKTKRSGRSEREWQGEREIHSMLPQFSETLPLQKLREDWY